VLTSRAQAQRTRDAYNERQVLAWHVAALQRTKRLPKLKTLLIEDEPQAPKRKRQTWQEQMAVMDQLAAIMRARLGSPMKRETNARRGDTTDNRR
jgi:septal ring factor EnvC (AmiA/AmiB activator)